MSVASQIKKKESTNNTQEHKGREDEGIEKKIMVFKYLSGLCVEVTAFALCHVQRETSDRWKESFTEADSAHLDKKQSV